MKYLKKAVCLLLAALTLAACFGCGSGGNDQDERPIDMAALRQAMLDVDTTLPEMVVKSSEDEDAKDNFFFLSSIDYGKVEEYFYAFAEAGTAEEIAVVKLKSKSDAAAMMDSLHDHVKSRQGTFEEYDPEQVPLTEGAVITREGRYVVLIVSKKNGLVQNTFQSFFQEG
ncbi:MAG: DUF4358 domain-containing protein [Clostridiales bacterium]|nr:DUF4358 domain-containing protein [Clostridiales bacterium]